MWIVVELISLLFLPYFVRCAPLDEAQQASFGLKKVYNATVRPLVIWHGLGDTHSSPGMLKFMDMVGEVHPGIFVHSIYIEENLDADHRAGFYGNVDDQLQVVAAQLAAVPELQGGFDAIGFSQGGQFLRAFVERYNAPAVHNLVTFGSQHMGVADVPLCNPADIRCIIARRAVKSGAYTAWAQKNLIQAQYFRDPAQLPAYFEMNKFLTSINNEVPDTANATYAARLTTLAHLVLVLFSEDETVVPKESAWFGSYAPPEEAGAAPQSIVPMRLQPVYLADTFGLRTLDERGRVTLEICEGLHMHLSRECWEPLVRRFAGGNVTASGMHE